MYNEDWECFHCQMWNNWPKPECYWCKRPKTTERDESRISVSVPSPDNDDYVSSYEWYNKSYEMRKIDLVGKGSNKYYWFICTPNFPSEQYKINDPHCHARKNDWSGEARISLDPSTHEPSKLKVKLGKISGTDQTEIRELVSRNKEHIYQEWKDEWIK